MGIDETPTFRHAEKLARGLSPFLRVNSMLCRIGLGSQKLTEAQRQLAEVRAGMRELADYNDRFNRHFSKDCWLAYGSIDFTVVKFAVDEYEAGRSDAANAALMQYFGPGSVGDRLHLLNGVEGFRVRRRLIDLALVDYQAGRYHAVVPVLLMLMDGAANDVGGKGLHAEEFDSEVWDSLTAAGGALDKVKAVFQQGRRKTRVEPILVPYRNGILHGMDLGYDNETVAAKCWCLLFVVADWIADKKSETRRQERFAEEARVPSLRELTAQIAENQRMKEANEAWSARQFRPDQVRGLGREERADPGTPEETVLRFLDLWAACNYGRMARLYWTHAEPESKGHAGHVRALLSGVSVGSYRLDQIDDEGPGVSQVIAVINPESNHPCRYLVRMICETDSGDVLPRGLPGGAWRVVWIQSCDS